MLVERTPSDDTSIEAEIRNVHAIGPVVRVELALCEKGETIEAQLPRETFRELDLKPGELVFVRTRNVKVFADDYVI